MSRRMLLEDNYSEDKIKWDIDKKSDTPISILELCSEYFSEINNADFKPYSKNQIMEIDISSFKNTLNEPRLMLLCDIGIGGQIYFNTNKFTVGNSGGAFSFKSGTITLELSNDQFNVYIDNSLIKTVPIYSSKYLPTNGIKLDSTNTDIIVTGFRYKNFEE